MSLFNTLSPAEQARQLANPEGRLGLDVAAWLNGNNADANARILNALRLEAGCRVLEIGFGNGREAANVLARAADVRYAGIDISPTMVREAERYNAAAIASGKASFHLAPADRMPFADASFDRVFASGVIHFWADPLASLLEVHRVIRSGSLSVMTALNPRSVLPFAKKEYGFFLRTEREWAALFHEAGFRDIDAHCIEVEGIDATGKPNKRYTNRITAVS